MVGALTFIVSPALAAPSQAEREAAHKFMDDGFARLKANDPQRALENFLKAHELMHVPTTGVAVAKAHLAAGHLVEAREAAVEVARTSKEPGEPKVFEKARREAREIESQTKSRIPTIRIHVRGLTASFVAIDGVELPLASLLEPIPVNPGKHVITAKASDGSEGRSEVESREGEKADVDVTVSPKSGPAEKTVEKPADKSPPATAKPAEKPKVLGFGNEEAPPHGSRRTPLAEGLIYGGFGIGTIGLGVGAVTGFMTLNRASDVKQSCENNVCSPAAKKDLDSANTLGAISTITVAIGIAGIGAGILGLAMPPKNAGAKTGIVVRPTLNGLGGTF